MMYDDFITMVHWYMLKIVKTSGDRRGYAFECMWACTQRERETERGSDFHYHLYNVQNEPL